ncbi:hypothetical protein SLW73_06225 [Glutamicibacter protophormiae]|uniref:hypothetical protein n=1 Tax=Glutamicibacter protophormiae TaxID=37930 RepID=UPI002A81AAE8|nr:hypothetical protein [Glutamicibacter protophormiae]WPR65912.1 hypothetical protein SLW72_06225 [Glutamicibacter protophormiae]WPR69411.1 hypothetical protein SLW73_06225 [Glutamicibacter protophormiae]
MKAGRNTPGGVPAARQQQAREVAAARSELGVLLFTLDPALPQAKLAQQLAEQFAELQLPSRVATAGPQRVAAVMDGSFTGIDVLVVLGDAGADTEDRLMELVEWLLANGRGALAENLIFAQLGQPPKHRPVPAFARVVLERNFAAEARKSGLRFPWAASSHPSWELAGAVLDYATGLGAE